jgi:hypothetical protein
MKGGKTKQLWKNPEYRKHMKEIHVGQKAWNKGVNTTIEHRRKLSLAHIGVQANEKHPMWQGEKVNYRNLHSWVVRWKGQPDTCEKCGVTKLKGRFIHWANVDHKYRRVLDDFIRLCAKCHKEYDKRFK